MNDFISLVFVSGDLLQTIVRCLILFFTFDCLIGVANAIKSVKGAAT